MNEERTRKCLRQVDHIRGTLNTFHDVRICIIKTSINNICLSNCVCYSYFQLVINSHRQKSCRDKSFFFYQILQLCPAWFVFVLQELVA